MCKVYLGKWLCIAVAVVIRTVEMFVPCLHLCPLLRSLKLSIFIPHKSCNVGSAGGALKPIVKSFFQMVFHVWFCFFIKCSVILHDSEAHGHCPFYILPEETLNELTKSSMFQLFEDYSQTLARSTIVMSVNLYLERSLVSFTSISLPCPLRSILS